MLFVKVKTRYSLLSRKNVWKDLFSIFCVSREALDSSAKRADTKVYLVCPKRYWKALSMHLQVWNRIPIRLLGKKRASNTPLFSSWFTRHSFDTFFKKVEKVHIFQLLLIKSTPYNHSYTFFKTFSKIHVFQQLMTTLMNRIFNGLFFKGNPYCIVVHWSGRPNDITRGLFAIMSGRTFLYGLLAMLLLLLLLTMMTRMIITI